MTLLLLVGLGGYLAGALTIVLIVRRVLQQAEREQIRRYLWRMRGAGG